METTAVSRALNHPLRVVQINPVASADPKKKGDGLLRGVSDPAAAVQGRNVA
jgi:hypothetical protein